MRHDGECSFFVFIVCACVRLSVCVCDCRQRSGDLTNASALRLLVNQLVPSPSPTPPSPPFRFGISSQPLLLPQLRVRRSVLKAHQNREKAMTQSRLLLRESTYDADRAATVLSPSLTHTPPTLADPGANPLIPLPP